MDSIPIQLDFLNTKSFYFKNLPIFAPQFFADVAKLVDALDLGSSASGHGGSSPSIRTNVWPLC